MNTSTPIIALKALAGNSPTHLVPMQVFLLHHFELIRSAWQSLWVVVLVAVCVHVVREYRAHRSRAGRQ